MKFDLKAPCKNCPFRSDETRITFECRERAEEIEDSAYRRGFPCHLSAEHLEETEYSDGGFVFAENTQHCVGCLLMWAHDGEAGNIPFEGFEESEQDRIRDLWDWDAPVFQSVAAFLDANSQGAT